MNKPEIQHGVTSAQQHSNKLEQYSLALRGDNINPIIDAATPLLGMVLRIQALSSPIDDPEYLYRQIVTDIQGVEQLLVNKGYEPGVTITFRYVLCTFIDECVMSAEPQLAKFWSQKSLLVHFHNEGWGGEKVFQILERLMNEPKRYKDMLEFFYLCFGLGFRGRYKVQNQNHDDFERLFRRLNTLIQSLNEHSTVTVLHQGQTKSTAYKLPNRLSVRHLFIGGCAVLAVSYFSYLMRLNSQSYSILEQLNTLLK